MIIFEKQEIRLRTLELNDAALLVKWLSDPVVLEFYEGRDRPHDLELVREHFYDEQAEVTRCIVQYKERDIGYLQFYLIDDEELKCTATWDSKVKSLGWTSSLASLIYGIKELVHGSLKKRLSILSK